jgi:putative membrane protein
MRYLFYLIWILVLIFGISFASLNAHEVDINIFVMSIHVFLPLLLLTVLVIGAFCGIFAMVPNILKFKYNNRKLRKQVHKLEQELKVLQPKSE